VARRSQGLPPLPVQVDKQVGRLGSFSERQLAEATPGQPLHLRAPVPGAPLFRHDPQHHFFRLVRSRTPPGQPIDLVVSRRPYDDPGVERVYYRLSVSGDDRRQDAHALCARTEAHGALADLFLKPTTRSTELPSYALEVASNPFVAFRALPVKARYQFMLDEAEFTIMGFIKGPVCRGQVALNVIEDQFWVFFQANTDHEDEQIGRFLEREASLLQLPAELGSDAGIIGPWREYAKREARYLQDKSDFLTRLALTRNPPELASIWNGEGHNPNAALTVFRHFDSASVVKGLVGDPPKTAWVIGYALLERIHYLLVAGFDVYGNVGHQLLTRLYMDFMRMESEFNFLAYLPLDRRLALRDHWYRGASEEVKDHVYGKLARFDVETGIHFRTEEPQQELYALLKQHLAPVLNRRYELATVADAALQADLALLARLRGEALSWLPELVYLRVDNPPRLPRYFTLLRNTGHSNVSSLLQEGRELLPAENTLTVAPGFIGAYPNALYRLQREEIRSLAKAIGELSSEGDYRALADRFSVRRTDPRFWQYSDELQDAHLKLAPITAGLLDYNRLENR
jgi:hypothetical protein